MAKGSLQPIGPYDQRAEGPLQPVGPSGPFFVVFFGEVGSPPKKWVNSDEIKFLGEVTLRAPESWTPRLNEVSPALILFKTKEYLPPHHAHLLLRKWVWRHLKVNFVSGKKNGSK